MMKRIERISFFIALLAIWAMPLFGQKNLRNNMAATKISNNALTPLSEKEMHLLKTIRELPVPEKGLLRELPYYHDNFGSPYLRPVFLQDGASCAQAATVGYAFTYEIDRARDVLASEDENQYPTHFAWNFMNWGGSQWFETGSSFFHTFEILKKVGTPSVEVYGGMSLRGDSTRWMSGYDNYYHAMQNRISDVYSIDVSNEEGLLSLKQWVHNHMEGSPNGGVANFYAGITGYNFLPQGTPEENFPVILNWYVEATHAMTIIGYNDSIRFDLNQDGQYTNNIDINMDGKVNMADWEIGGFKIVNSYDTDWGHLGTSYVLYRTLAERYGVGGIWDNKVYVMKARDNYSPKATMKVQLSHTSRETIKIYAGISNDTSLSFPDFTLDFPIIDFQGGDIYLGGGQSEEDKTIEFGLDITPMLSYYDNEGPVKLFFQVEERDPNNQGTGNIGAFSVIDYTDGFNEFVCHDTPVNLIENDITTVSVIANIENWTNNVHIEDTELPLAESSQYYEYQLSASGGTTPYQWDQKIDYTLCPVNNSMPMVEEEKLSPNLDHNGTVWKKLDFSFPFYNKVYDSVLLHTSGAILFSKQSFPWPYLKDLHLLLESSKMIAPFFCDDLINYDVGGNGIWYEGNQEYAIFRWQMSDENWITSSSYGFAVKLFANGDIEFFYDDMVYTEPVDWISGISDGDFFNQTIASSNHIIALDVISGAKMKSPDLPSGITISESGLLSGTPGNMDHIYDIVVRVKDEDDVFDTKTLTFSSALELGYTCEAGDDQVIERNEEVSVSLVIKNRSLVNYSQGTITLSLEDPYITLLNNNVDFDNILPGETLEIENAFLFSTSTDIPDEHPLFGSIQISADRFSVTKNIEWYASAPKIKLGDITIRDYQDQVLNPGENADLLIKLNNRGHARGYQVVADVYSDDPYISINENPVLHYGDIHSNDYGLEEFSITANPSTPKGHIAHFTIMITDSVGFYEESEFNVMVSPNPILIVDLDENLNSGLSILEAVNNNHISANYATFLPWWDLYKYDAVFVCLGVFPLNYELEEEEGAKLANYLNEGGNLYLEGGATWFLNEQTEVHPMFNVEASTISWPNGATLLDGQPGTITEGMTFAYDGDNTRLDHLAPVEPAVSLFLDRDTDHSFVVLNEAIEYKTIGSSVEFGGFRDSIPPSTRKDLMCEYLKFFNLNSRTLAANFVADKLVVNKGETVTFLNISTPDATEWSWEFNGGIPETSTEENPQELYEEEGVFDVTLTVTNGTESNTLTKNLYITVGDETGIDNHESQYVVKIFPNPASGIVFIKLSEAKSASGGLQVTGSDHVSLKIYNLHGQEMMTLLDGILPAGEHIVSFNTKHLPSGVYIWQCTLTESNYIQTGKLIVH